MEIAFEILINRISNKHTYVIFVPSNEYAFCRATYFGFNNSFSETNLTRSISKRNFKFYACTAFIMYRLIFLIAY